MEAEQVVSKLVKNGKMKSWKKKEWQNKKKRQSPKSTVLLVISSTYCWVFPRPVQRLLVFIFCKKLI